MVLLGWMGVWNVVSPEWLISTLSLSQQYCSCRVAAVKVSRRIQYCYYSSCNSENCHWPFQSGVLPSALILCLYYASTLVFWYANTFTIFLSWCYSGCCVFFLFCLPHDSCLYYHTYFLHMHWMTSKENWPTWGACFFVGIQGEAVFTFTDLGLTHR